MRFTPLALHCAKVFGPVSLRLCTLYTRRRSERPRERVFVVRTVLCERMFVGAFVALRPALCVHCALYTRAPHSRGRPHVSPCTVCIVYTTTSLLLACHCVVLCFARCVCLCLSVCVHACARASAWRMGVRRRSLLLLVCHSVRSLSIVNNKKKIVNYLTIFVPQCAARTLARFLQRERRHGAC